MHTRWRDPDSIWNRRRDNDNTLSHNRRWDVHVAVPWPVEPACKVHVCALVRDFGPHMGILGHTLCNDVHSAR